MDRIVTRIMSNQGPSHTSTLPTQEADRDCTGMTSPTPLNEHCMNNQERLHSSNPESQEEDEDVLYISRYESRK